MRAGVYVQPYLISARRTLHSGGELMIMGFFYALLIVIFAALWKAATEASGGTVAGYSAVALVWYMVASEAVILPVHQRLIERISDDINGGAVSSEMLRPASVIGVRLAREFGWSHARLLVLLPVGAVLGMLLGGALPSAGCMLAFVPAAVLAVACNVASQHVFGALAFRLRDVRVLWFLYQKAIFLCGGMLLPLEIFPDWLQRIVWCLPFWTMSYGPARLLSGHFEPWLLAGQVAWFVVLMGLAFLVFARGERRLLAVGS